MKPFYKCLISALLLVAIVLPMGGCRPAGQEQGNDEQSSQGSASQGGNGSQTDDKYSKYSPLLQEVLADPYYDNLYRRYESGEIGVDGSAFDSGINLMEAIPYDFLANKDEDIEGIKNGAIRVNSYLYTIQNEEKDYIYDNIEITYKVKDGENHIHQYLLQYKITEQELEELTMLYRGKYFQGPAMFQRLASKQTPTVLADFGITEKAYTRILSVCNSTSQYATLSKLLNHDKILNFTLTSLDYGIVWDEKSFDITFNLINEGNTNGSVSQKTLYKVSSSLIYSTSKVSYTNGLLNLESFSGVNPKIIETTPITYFLLSGGFKNFKF